MCGKLGEDIACRVHSPSKAWSHEEKVNIKGVSKPRTVFGSCREREDLRLSSGVARWLRLVALSKSTKDFGGRKMFRHELGGCKRLHLTGPFLSLPGQGAF